VEIPPPSPGVQGLTVRTHLIPLGGDFRFAARHLILQLFAGKYFVSLFLRGGSQTGDAYLFQSKVQVVDAFVSAVLSLQLVAGG
jgi:hypothetical protein